MIYLFDSDALIQAANKYYSFRAWPGFWKWIEQKHAEGVFFSVEKVHKEIGGDRNKADPLKPWADKMGATFFLPPDEKTIACMSTVAEWVNKQTRLFPAAKAGFLDDIADQYLIAHALAHHDVGCCIITQEDSRPASQSSLKIPDACKGLGVKSMNLFELFDVFPPGL